MLQWKQQNVASVLAVSVGMSKTAVNLLFLPPADAVHLLQFAYLRNMWVPAVCQQWVESWEWERERLENKYKIL